MSSFIGLQNKPKENPDELDLELFGEWQTEIYVPPPPKDVSTSDVS